MKLQIKKGATDVSLVVFVNDSTSTTGAGKTGLAYNTASLTCYYVRPGSAAAQLNLATQTVTGAHADGGFVEVDATNMPGVYRLDLSDAIVASGVNSVVVMLKGATGMAPVLIELELVAYDPQDAVRGGMTALPNVASGGDGAIMLQGASVDAALKSLTVTNSGGNAVTLSSSGSNGHGLRLAGNGSGEGLSVVGGNAGHGAEFIGGTSGSGVGLRVKGGNSGNGVTIEGGDNDGHGLSISGLDGTGKHGATISSLATNGDGLRLGAGTGTGVALNAANIVALLDDIPTNAEFQARTIVAANYALEATLTAMKGATFDTSTDSLEALRNRGDAAWTTATGFSTHTAADVWTSLDRTLTAGTNIVLAKGTGITGFNDLSAAQVNAECDQALADYDAPTNAEMVARTLVAGSYATAATQTSQGGTLNGIVNETDKIPTILTNLAALWTTALTESYAADGAAPSPAQLLFMIYSALSQFDIAGTTITCRKLDGTTVAMTFTLDDGTNPTSRTRAS